MFLGSGFIINSTRILATNYHVISSLLTDEKPSIATKMESGDFVKVEKIVGVDENNDVALLKLEGKDFPSVKLARDYKLKQGDDVVVIGSPFGLESTFPMAS
jgi:serine protease Do